MESLKVEFEPDEYLIEEKVSCGADGEYDDFDGLERENTCVYCSIYFDDTNDLINHIKTHFDFQCKECKKGYPSKRCSKHNVRSNREYKNFVCKICGRSFRMKFNAQEHILSHSSKPLLKCSFCDRKFYHSSSLRQHERIHRECHRKQCPICKEYVTRLSNHIHTHSKEKLFKCSFCEKSFARENYLQKHEEGHRGTMYNCQECTAAFKSKTGLYKHKKSTHNNENYICEILSCGQKFNRRDNMFRHMKVRHRVEVETIINSNE